jgi:hypothetical protein
MAATRRSSPAADRAVRRPCCPPAPGRAGAASSSFPGRIAQLHCPTPPQTLPELTPAARCFPRTEARRNRQPRRPPPPADRCARSSGNPSPNRAPQSNPSNPSTEPRPSPTVPAAGLAGIWPEPRRPCPRGPHCKRVFLLKGLTAKLQLK